MSGNSSAVSSILTSENINFNIRSNDSLCLAHITVISLDKLFVNSIQLYAKLTKCFVRNAILARASPARLAPQVRHGHLYSMNLYITLLCQCVLRLEMSKCFDINAILAMASPARLAPQVRHGHFYSMNLYITLYLPVCDEVGNVQVF